MRGGFRADRAVVAALLALAAARAAAAVGLAPGRDELAYWWWATRGLDACYSLVTTAAIRVSTELLGDSAWAMRLPGLLAAGLAAAVLAVTIRRLGGSRGLAAAAALALAGSLWQSYVGTVAHPDAWLTLWVALFGMSTADLARHPGPGRLVAPAIWVALAALTKLTGLVLFLPAAWLIARRARHFPRAAGVAGGLLAGAGAWLAFSWDGRTLSALRELGRFDPGLTPWARVPMTALEIALLAGPALLLLAVSGALALRSRPARAAWPAGAAAALIVGSFAAFLAAGQSKGNWFLPAAVLLAPPGAIALERAGRTRLLRGVSLAAVLVPSFVAVLLVVPPSHWPGALDRTYAWHTGQREQHVSPTATWVERLREYGPEYRVDPREAREMAGGGAAAVGSHDYGLAFAVAWALGRGREVWLPGDPMFAATCGPPAAGSDVLWVTRTGRPPPEAAFREVTPVSPRGRADLEAFRCREFGGVPPAEEESATMISRTVSAFLVAAVASAPVAAASAPVAADSAAPAAELPDHGAFDSLLQEYVTPFGVRYEAWHANGEDRAALQAYLEHLQSIPISSIEAGEEGEEGRNEALAYWINLYNAATLDLVLDGYPVGSIKDLGNLIRSPWKRGLVVVEGEKLSLDEIENAIIRPRFGEPRIHFALNCAAIGCPPMRPGAFTAGELASQLEQQTAAFLGDPKRNWVDEEGRLHLSKILDWYESDFVQAAGSVENFVRPYMPMLQELKPGEPLRIVHVKYDWSLNEMPEVR